MLYSANGAVVRLFGTIVMMKSGDSNTCKYEKKHKNRDIFSDFKQIYLAFVFHLVNNL